MILTGGLLPRFFTTSLAPNIAYALVQVVGLFVHVRLLLLLLPAVALGARRGVLRDGWRRTRGHLWLLLAGLAITDAPCWLLGLAFLDFRSWRHVPPTVSATSDVAVEALGLLSLVLDAAFAAQVFTDLPRRSEPVADHAS